MSFKIRSILNISMVIALVSSLLTFTSAPAQATALTCAQGGVCQVGDIGPGGGRIFYVSATRFTQEDATGSMCTNNCLYLEVAPSRWLSNPDPTRAWDTTSGVDVTGITNDASAFNNALGIGLGYKNSTTIVAQRGSSNAAGEARGYGGGSKNDWYLPTIAEMNLLCQWVRGVASSVTTRCSGGSINSSTYRADSAEFLAGNYWTSSERNANDGWMQRFDSGQQGTAIKSFYTYIRPIRAFAPTVDGLTVTRASVGTERRAAFTTQHQVTIRNFDNETVTASSAIVTATVSAGGTLIGTTSATASAGIATFNNLGVDGIVGSNYTITFSSSGIVPTSATVTLSGTNCDGATFTCQVGDIGPGGGRIFYVASGNFTQQGATGFMCTTSCKYLEAAPTTGTNAWTDTFYRWSGNIDTLIGTTGTAIGTGYKNTLAIVAQSNTPDKAGTVTRTYRGPNNLTDWYLPAKDELNQLCRWARGNSVSDVPCFQGTNNSGLGAAGFIENYYWSSSEFSTTNTWSQPFAGDPTSGYSKNDENWVRPIRAFGTPPTTISIANIGISVPVTGATPVTSLASNGQYTAAITWNGSPTTFAAATVYTATIYVTAAAGYTLTAVTANFFRVVGATSVTHSGESGEVTVIFPSTSSPPPSLLKVKIPPTISLTADTYTCDAGALIFWRQSVTEEPSKLAYQKISLMRDGAEVASSVTLKTATSFERISTWTGSTMTCQIYTAQENTVGTFSSLGADKYNELSRAKSAAIKALEAKHLADRRAKNDMRRFEIARISELRVSELKSAKTTAQVRAASERYRLALTRTTDTWKAEIKATSEARTAARDAATTVFIQGLANHGLAIVQP